MFGRIQRSRWVHRWRAARPRSAGCSTTPRSSGSRSPGTRRTPATTSRSRCARRPPCLCARNSKRVRILFLADVFGTAGRTAVEERLPGLREELGVAFCVVNGENAADGRGITARLADKLLGAGADVITLGNHVWARDDIGPYLAASERVIRPANVASGSPGRALAVAPATDGTPVAVINLLGSLFLDVPSGFFEVVDDLVEEARAQSPLVIVDFHAEATSEKIALARYLDGRVTAVLGTHTHVQTSDARIQPGGTAAITDAGMTGPHDSVIGVEAELAIRRMRTGMPVRFRPAEGGVRIEGVVLDCDAEGRATAIEPLRVEHAGRS